MIGALDIVARLQADATVSALAKYIAPGDDMPSLTDQLQTSPTIFVGEGFDERAETSSAGSGVTRQKATGFFVVMLVFNQIGASGNEQNAATIALREAVKASLVGWTPNSQVDSPMEYGGAKTVGFDTDNDVLVYQCNFFSTYTIRGVNA